MALARRVDAIILTGIVTDADLRARLRAHQALVIETWGLPVDPIDVAIGFSHREAGAALARFLSARGYRRAHLVVPRSPRAQHRAEGFAAGWVAAGNVAPTRLEVGVPSHFGQGRLSFKVISELAQRPDVVVCGSDWIAQGLIVEAHANSVRVPADFAVTGFGNLALAGDMRPTITTVEVDGRRIAQEVLRVLRARGSGGEVEKRINVGFKIVARESA